jgi:chorismate-pyruvate lyase
MPDPAHAHLMTSEISTIEAPHRTIAHLPSWAALWEHFAQQSGRRPVRLKQIPGAAMPQPFRSLLVHSRDMTPTLEAFYGRALRLTVLSQETRDAVYMREVTLDLEGLNHPVAYGFSRIPLEHYPAKARQLVVEARQPLGRILQTEGISHMGWPNVFFGAECGARMGALLRVQRPGQLYGRRNLLLDGSRQLLAEVIEVLGPVKCDLDND